MNYFDSDMNLREANETTVYRVFGGDSGLEGGFITCEEPANPIQARCDLALSQHDFTDDEGNPVRNLASEVATGTVFTDDEGYIINPQTGDVTDNVLDFQPAEPVSDLPGGGLEYQLEDDFENVVQVDSVDELRHESTEGWTDYLAAEEEVISNLSDSGADDGADEWMESDSTTDSQAFDDLIDDEVYDIQKGDTDSIYEDVDWTDPDDEGRDERSIDNECYNDTDHSEEGIDALIEDEIYEAQAEDVEESWADENDYSDDYDSSYDDDYSRDDY